VKCTDCDAEVGHFAGCPWKKREEFRSEPLPLRAANLLGSLPDWRARLLSARAAFKLAAKLDETVTDALALLAARTTPIPLCDECAQFGEACRRHRALAERTREELAQLDQTFLNMWERLEELVKSLPPVEGKRTASHPGPSKGSL
jgi:hypothetical protein